MVFVIGIARNCSGLHTSSKIGNSGGDTLDIAMLYGPGSMYLYSDSLSGLNLEISKAFEKNSDIPMKIWPVTDASDAMAKVKSGIFDILASLPLDNNIKKEFLTTESLFLDRLVLVQKKDSVTGETIVNSSIDLTGKTVYVAPGSSAYQRLENLSNEIGGDIKIKVEDDLSDELLCLKVASGAVKYAVVNEKIAKKVSEKYSLLSYDNPISFTQFQVWLFNPNDSVPYNGFTEWFEIFRNSDEYRELLNKF